MSDTCVTTVPRKASPGAVWAALIAVYICWGSTYLAIRYAIETIPPMLMGGTRFLIAGMIMYVYSTLRGAARPTGRQWRSAAIVGALLLLFGNGLVVFSETVVPSGIVALIIGIAPFWMILLDWIWMKAPRPRATTFAGLFTGILGLVILVGNPLAHKAAPGHQSAFAIHPGGLIAIIIATLSWCVGSLYSRRADLPKSQIQATAMEMLCGGILMTFVSLLLGDFRDINVGAISMKSVGALAYLVVFGSIIGFSCYVYSLQVTTPTRASTYAFVNPIVAVFLGWWLAGEELSPRVLLAAALIVGAVALTLRRDKRVECENV